MLIVMSVKFTLTDELLKVTSALELIFSVIEDKYILEDNEVRNEEDSTSKQAHVSDSSTSDLSSFTLF